MKSLKKSMLVAGVVGTVGAGGLFTGAVANAESGTASTDPMSSLVEKLATTFKLDKTNVQEVFDAQRTEMNAQREQEQKERLQKLVDNKTITVAQKTAIEAKLAEMKKEREANKDSFKDLSETERKTRMDAKRTELETWAKAQGLDLAKLQGVFRGPGGHGGGGPRG